MAEAMIRSAPSHTVIPASLILVLRLLDEPLYQKMGPAYTRESAVMAAT